MSKLNSNVVLKKSDNLLYQCRLCKITNWDLHNRELINENGFIAFSNNPEWDLPVIKIFNDNICEGRNVTVLFICEDKQTDEWGAGSGKRRVVRIYGLPNEAQSKEPQYRLTFIKINSDEVPEIQNHDNVRFYFKGSADPYDTDLYKTDWFFVIIAKSDEPVIFKADNAIYEC